MSKHVFRLQNICSEKFICITSELNRITSHDSNQASTRFHKSSTADFNLLCKSIKNSFSHNHTGYMFSMSNYLVSHQEPSI